MEDALFSYAPNNSAAAQTAGVAIIIALGAVAGMMVLLKKKATGRSYNQNMLAAMLLFFVAMIGSGAAFFSWWKIRKTTPVAIYQNAVETPYGKVPFSRIKDAYIYTDNQPSLVNPGQNVRSTKILVLQEQNGKTHALSEKDYPIKEILPKLQNTFDEWKEKRK